MSKPDRDLAVVLDIVLACRDVESFLRGVERAAFLEEEAGDEVRKTRSAVIHQLLVVGEATKRLSNELRAANPQVPWQAMAGLRDRLIHGYDEIDLDRVWQISTVEVPKVRRHLEHLLPPSPAER
jgi:uncharacterized protein with HEPN domain